MRSLTQQYGDQLSFVFRHFPLTQIHPQAQKAAAPAEVAAEQGQFWPMHERLFEHQSALDDGSLVEHAIALGLNMPRFLWNLSQHVYAKRVQADLLSGVESGVSGTPTFFINGIRLKESIQPFSTLRNLPLVLDANSRLQSCELINQILADSIVLRTICLLVRFYARISYKCGF